MKLIHKTSGILILFILCSGLVYATSTIASQRKSTALPWQGTRYGTYDAAHNVGSNHNADNSRFSFVFGSSGNGVVKDRVTNRMWQSNGREGIDLNQTQEGVDYCSNLRLGGYTDWRLPNPKEMHSIQDYSRSNPAINTSFFTTWKSGYLVYMPKLNGQLTEGIFHFYYNVNGYSPYWEGEGYAARCVRVDDGTPVGCGLPWGDRLSQGESINAYSIERHANCASYMQRRTCNNGVLSGSNQYKFGSCVNLTCRWKKGGSFGGGCLSRPPLQSCSMSNEGEKRAGVCQHNNSPSATYYRCQCD